MDSKESYDIVDSLVYGAYGVVAPDATKPPKRLLGVSRKECRQRLDMIVKSTTLLGGSAEELCHPVPPYMFNVCPKEASDSVLYQFQERSLPHMLAFLVELNHAFQQPQVVADGPKARAQMCEHIRDDTFELQELLQVITSNADAAFRSCAGALLAFVSYRSPMHLTMITAKDKYIDAFLKSDLDSGVVTSLVSALLSTFHRSILSKLVERGVIQRLAQAFSDSCETLKNHKQPRSKDGHRCYHSFADCGLLLCQIRAWTQHSHPLLQSKSATKLEPRLPQQLAAQVLGELREYADPVIFEQWMGQDAIEPLYHPMYNALLAALIPTISEDSFSETFFNRLRVLRNDKNIDEDVRYNAAAVLDIHKAAKIRSKHAQKHKGKKAKKRPGALPDAWVHDTCMYARVQELFAQNLDKRHENAKCCYPQCGKVGGRMQACARCGVARYCSRNCQKLDWKLKHKEKCFERT